MVGVRRSSTPLTDYTTKSKFYKLKDRGVAEDTTVTSGSWPSKEDLAESESRNGNCNGSRGSGRSGNGSGSGTRWSEDEIPLKGIIGKGTNEVRVVTRSDLDTGGALSPV